MRDVAAFVASLEPSARLTGLAQLTLKLTARMVDNLEVAMPGFKVWLHLTGYGNDKTMIKGFLKWAEYENEHQVEHILPAVRKVMDG